MEVYKNGFYKHRHAKTEYSARIVLSMLVEILPEIKSVVDLGCGVGTWLSVLKESGIQDIQGFDGNWVNKEHLVIPEECFIEHDLSKELRFSRRYGLAISLEVAEHLPSETATSFVASMTNLSDFVLFSAAIPYQGGKNHINEQWPEYWAALFKERGYIVLDIIRKQIWNDEKIPVWYKQNILLFVKEERVSDLNFANDIFICRNGTLSVVHPSLYFYRETRNISLKGSWKLFRRALRAWIKYRLYIARPVTELHSTDR